jgi:dolichol-phosphate mannosyltransferase
MTHATTQLPVRTRRVPGHAAPGTRPAEPVALLRAAPQSRPPVDIRYDDASLPNASIREPAVAPRGTGYLPYRYSVAGLLTVGSQIALPELEYFRAPALGRDLDIEIRVGKVGRGRPRARARLLRFEGPAGVRYEEHLGRFAANFAIDLGDRIQVTVSHLLARSAHVAYTNVVEALLRFALASRGYLLLHSACVEIDGRGVLLSARTDTGKTGTVLRLLRERGAKFLSEDMPIVAPDGTATCFPKPLTISSHTLRAVDPGDLRRPEWLWLGVKSRVHSKSGRGVGMAIGNQNLPVMTANAITQILVSPPKYDVDRLVACELTHSTTISEAFIIERGTPSMSDVPTGEALPELIENTDDAYGFPPFRYLAPVLVMGGAAYDELRRRELDVLRSALQGVRVRRMVSDSFDWADRIPQALGR